MFKAYENGPGEEDMEQVKPPLLHCMDPPTPPPQSVNSVTVSVYITIDVLLLFWASDKRSYKKMRQYIPNFNSEIQLKFLNLMTEQIIT